MSVKVLKLKIIYLISLFISFVGFPVSAFSQAYGENGYGQCEYGGNNCSAISGLSLPSTGTTILAAISLLLLIVGIIWFIILRKKRKQQNSPDLTT